MRPIVIQIIGIKQSENVQFVQLLEELKSYYKKCKKIMADKNQSERQMVAKSKAFSSFSESKKPAEILANDIADKKAKPAKRISFQRKY